MFAKNYIFWNVDTQVDFISANGKLYVPGSEEILPTLQQLSLLAKLNNIQVINTADFHYGNSPELSDSPNFISTFPPHCMANTLGADYVPETKPEPPFCEILWDKEYSKDELMATLSFRNIIIRKDKFDVFKGNLNTEALLNLLSPQKVFVYGVTTNVCVDCAVRGLIKRNIEVFVIEDAIKELPNISLPFKNWDELGVKRIKFVNLINHLD